jgi:hypothetical protein
MRNSRGGSVPSLVRLYGSKRDSMNTDPSRGCEGKQKFRTFGDAEQIAKKARRRKDKALKVYRCHECSGYHFGNWHGSRLKTRRSYRVDLSSGVEE